MSRIRPVSDLKYHFEEISKTIHETNQPLFLTETGLKDMVLLSMETYERMRFDAEIYHKLQVAADEEIQTDIRYTSEEILQSL